MVLANPLVILRFFPVVGCAKIHSSVERPEVGIWLFRTYQTCLDCISFGGEDGCVIMETMVRHSISFAQFKKYSKFSYENYKWFKYCN
jgi:hypothetical protein